MNAGLTSNNIAYVTSDPLYAIVRFFHSGQVAPVGVNWVFFRIRKSMRLSTKQADLRPGQAGRADGKAHDYRRRRRAGVGGARHQPACALAQGERSSFRRRHWFQT